MKHWLKMGQLSHNSMGQLSHNWLKMGQLSHISMGQLSHNWLKMVNFLIFLHKQETQSKLLRIWIFHILISFKLG